MRVQVRLKNDLPIAADATIKEVGQGLYQAAERVMTDSKENYVPVVTGELRRSGFVDYPQSKSLGRIGVVLGYGRTFPSRRYAVTVHEAPPEYGQGRRKFLTRALFHNAPQIPGWIAESVKAAMSRRSP